MTTQNKVAKTVSKTAAANVAPVTPVDEKLVEGVLVESDAEKELTEIADTIQGMEPEKETNLDTETDAAQLDLSVLPTILANPKAEKPAFISTIVDSETGTYTIQSIISSTYVKYVQSVTDENLQPLADFLNSEIIYSIERAYKDGAISQEITLPMNMVLALAGAGIAERISTNTSEKEKGLDWLDAFEHSAPSPMVLKANSNVAAFSWPVLVDSLDKRTIEPELSEMEEVQVHRLFDKFTLKQILGMQSKLFASDKWTWLKERAEKMGYRETIIEDDDELF